jgi:hypothetical protein
VRRGVNLRVDGLDEGKGGAEGGGGGGDVGDVCGLGAVCEGEVEDGGAGGG